MDETIQQLSLSSADHLNNIKCDTTPQTGPFKCAVLHCKNNFVNFETHQISPYKFHNFPTNFKYSERWKVLCNLPPYAETSSFKVCSDHFRYSDYVVRLKKESLNPNFKRFLRENALPLLNVEDCSDTRGRSVSKIIRTDSPEADDEDKQLLSEITKLKNQIQEVKRRNTWRRQNIKRKQKQIEVIRKEISGIEEETANSKDKILRTLFSEAQVNVLKVSPKKIFWSNDDLAQAFTLRHKGGKDLYLYLKNTLNYPLPSLGCIQAWAANN